jgi:hypothetical protein
MLCKTKNVYFVWKLGNHPQTLNQICNTIVKKYREGKVKRTVLESEKILKPFVNLQ